MRHAKAAMLGAVLGTLLLAGPVRSQARWQADMRIQSVTVVESRGPAADRTGGRLTATVVVYSANDDDAQNPTLIVFLPVGVRFLGSSAGCVASVTSSTTQATATCRLTTMAVGATRTVSVTTTVPPSGFSKKFGAFVWSLTPDPDPANNYGEGTAP